MTVNPAFSDYECNLGKSEHSGIIHQDIASETNNVNLSAQSTKERINTKRKIIKRNFLLKEQCFLQQSSIHTLAELLHRVLIAWAAIYVVIQEAFLPKSDLFKLFFLVLSSYSTGTIFTMMGLPHVVGMFVIGSILKSVGYFNLSIDYEQITPILRLLAISVTLTKAGLAVNLPAIFENKCSVLKYSFIPSTMEALTFAIMAKYIFNFPWLWAFLFGYAISATSSQLGLNALSNLKNQGEYENGRMRTLMENSGYIDNIYSIVAFTVCLTTINFAFKGEVYQGLLYGLLDLIVAFLLGVILGTITACFPHKNDEYMLQKRCLLAFLNGTCTYFGCKVIGFPSGGALSCFVVAATSSFCWKVQGWTTEHNPVLNFQSKLWSLLMEPLLFGLVGTEIDLNLLEFKEIGIAFGMFTVIVLVRIIVGMVTLMGDGFNNKEKIFIIMSWMPKATVQAALCPQSLDMLRNSEDPLQEDINKAKIVIRISVLAVVFITTLSSITIKCGSKKLLKKQANRTENA